MSFGNQLGKVIEVNSKNLLRKDLSALRLLIEVDSAKPIPLEVAIRVFDGTYKIHIREVSYVEDQAIEIEIDNTEALRNFPLCETRDSGHDLRRTLERRFDSGVPKVYQPSDTGTKPRDLPSRKTGGEKQSPNRSRDSFPAASATRTKEESTLPYFCAMRGRDSAEKREGINRKEERVWERCRQT